MYKLRINLIYIKFALTRLSKSLLNHLLLFFQKRVTQFETFLQEICF